MAATQEYTLKFDLPGLLQLLGANIYSDPEVCIREMIQNAHDGCVRRQVEQPGFAGPQIRVSINRASRTLTFKDNGAGMTEDEIHDYLSTIGRGYTADLRRILERGNRREAELLIGQFGLGLLSAFAIADRVEILTRSYKPGSPTLHWDCSGDARYTVSRSSEEREPGSTVILHVQDKHIGILNEERLRKAIKRYADLLGIPIYLGEEQKPINAMNAPWRSDATTVEYLEYVRTRFNVSPLEVIPVKSEGDVTVYGVLYIPESSALSIGEYGDLDIYVRGMFIKGEDRALLPRWAKFVRGVIDSPSLTPTVGRDAVVIDEAYLKVRCLLGEIILGHLEYLDRTDPRRLRSIVLKHNTLIKAWALEDDEFFDRVANLVEFDTNVGRLTIPEYLRRSGGLRVFYFSEAGSGTQQKVLFGAKNMPVIDASYGAEEAFLLKYAARNPRVLVCRLDAESEYIFNPVASDPEWKRLEDEYWASHRIEARVVAFDPEDLPAVLVSKQMDKRSDLLESILKSDQASEEIKLLISRLRPESDRVTEGPVTQGTILYLNARNKVVQMLRCTDVNDEVFHLALTVLYNNAVLFSQHVITAENAVTMCRSNNKAVELMLAYALRLKNR